MNVLRRVWKTQDFSVIHRNKSGAVRFGDHGSQGMSPNREGKTSWENVLQNIRGSTSFLVFGAPFWRNGTFRIYERPFQDAGSRQACPDDVRRLLLRFRVVRFQR